MATIEELERTCRILIERANEAERRCETILALLNRATLVTYDQFADELILTEQAWRERFAEVSTEGQLRRLKGPKH